MPARISGVSMLPPQLPGVSDDRTSPSGGATPTVPCIGSSGRSTWTDESRASYRTSPAALSIS